MRFLVFLGQCFCKRTSRALLPTGILKQAVDYFSPVTACPYLLSFHFSVVWLITSLSGLGEVICCTSLPGRLPRLPLLPAAAFPHMKFVPFPLLHPSPSPAWWGEKMHLWHICLSQTCPRYAGGNCASLGAPVGLASPPRARAVLGRRQGEKKGEERQISQLAAQHPGGSREPASIWSHQAKQLCWVPYVGGARIHDIRAHLLYNKLPPSSRLRSLFFPFAHPPPVISPESQEKWLPPSSRAIPPAPSPSTGGPEPCPSPAGCPLL